MTLFVSGCDFHCEGCHNPQTWNISSGRVFTKEDKKVLFEYLSRDYIQGITFLGGEPLHENNLLTIDNLIEEINLKFPTKDIWLYTGYTWEELLKDVNRLRIVKKCSVIVDGRFIKSLADVNCHWCGSTNQRVIDIQKTISNDNKIILLEDKEKNQNDLNNNRSDKSTSQTKITAIAIREYLLRNDWIQDVNYANKNLMVFFPINKPNKKIAIPVSEKFEDFKVVVKGVLENVAHYMGLKSTDILKDILKVQSEIDFLMNNDFMYYCKTCKKKIGNKYEVFNQISDYVTCPYCNSNLSLEDLIFINRKEHECLE